VRKAEAAKGSGGSHSLETGRQKEGCGTILWRDLIELRRQRGYNQQAKGQRNYESYDAEPQIEIMKGFA
jgi:hypothetical protein